MITRENFEVYAADFLDGKLSSEETILFLAFLRENPDLKELLSEMDEFCLTPRKESFVAKETLHKDFALKTKVTADNFDEFAVASSENLLNLQQEQNLELYLTQHPEKLKDLELFRKVHLSPDLSLHFPSKKALYRGQKRTLLYYREAFAIAASFLLLVGLYLLMERPFSKTHLAPETTIVQVSASNESFEEIRSLQKPENSSKPKYTAMTGRSGMQKGKNQVTQAQMTTETEVEIALKEVQPIPLQPVPYAHPSLGIQATLTGTPSSTLQQKTREEYLSLSELAAREIRKRIKPTSTTDNIPITLWDVAEVGVNGLGKLTGANIRLHKKYNPDGNCIAVNFESPVFAVSAPVKKNN